MAILSFLYDPCLVEEPTYSSGHAFVHGILLPTCSVLISGIIIWRWGRQIPRTFTSKDDLFCEIVGTSGGFFQLVAPIETNKITF